MGVRLRGSIRVPGDKSVSHRAFLIPALAEGTALVRNALDSEDVARSRALAEAFGSTVVRDGEGWRVTGGPPREPPDVVDCGNSGTTMRLGCGVLAHAPGLRVLTGDGSLRTRPMARILGPLAQLGLEVRGREGDTRAPLVLRGGVEHTGTFDLPVADAFR